MKFKTLSRSETAHTRERRDDVLKVARNPDPSLHPFERAREYTRALNAAKLDKVFAKPLVGAMDGHMDGVWCMTPSPTSLTAFVTGACDGELRVWDLPRRKCLWATPAHTGFVRAISVAADGQWVYSCGDDKTTKMWRLSPDALLGNKRGRRSGGKSEKSSKKRARNLEDDDDDDDDEEEESESESESESEEEDDEELDIDTRIVTPVETFTSPYALQGIDCHWSEPRFATCGERVDIWDRSRSEPVSSFSWGCDSVRSVRFNPAERDLMATTGSDRSICLYDVRQDTPLRKVVLSMKSNALAWNPQEPLNFTVANEDHNLYSFDMRNLSKATIVHKDHVGAVMDISFSPTGKEFVTGSYDKTVRLFKSLSGRSYQVYHTRRMQRVFCSIFSRDASFVLSGSDDTNIRVWKANASKPLGRMLPRERQKYNYNQKLIARFKHVDDLNRVHRHLNEPKAIKKEREKKRVMRDAARVKDNRRITSDPNAPRPKPERTKAIVAQLQ